MRPKKEIQKYQEFLKKIPELKSPEKKTEIKQQETKTLSKDKAATTIQKFWRSAKIRDRYLKNSYNTYFSLNFQDEKNIMLLNRLMYGVTVSPFLEEKDKKDPFTIINSCNELYTSSYHRHDIPEGKLFNKLLLDF